MEKVHRDKLRRQAVSLTKDLDVTDEFLAVFVAERILGESNREELLLPHKTKKQRSSEFQMLIQKKGPRAFGVLIDALVQTNQNHLAAQLDPHLTAKLELQLETDICSPHISQETTPPIQPPASLFGNTAPVNNENASFMTIRVPPTHPNKLKYIMDLGQKELAYDVKHHPRGKFIIINNEYFAKKSERQGSKYDVINLSELAQQLELKEVTKNKETGITYDNLTGQQIIDEVTALSKADYSDHDAFVFCIMSHGANGIVYGVDGVKVSIESEICAPFDGKHCPSLSGKPKLFIIQACQGESAVAGVPQADDDENDAQGDISQAMRNLRIGDTNETVPIKIGHKIPHKSDMMVAYSTVPGYKSWRRPDLGSWFIRAIVTIFSEHAHEEDVQSLFTMVKGKVSAEKTHYIVGDEYIQMPRTDDTLRKKFFFCPGFRKNLTSTNA